MDDPDELRLSLKEICDLQRKIVQGQKTLANIGCFLCFVGAGICGIFITELAILIFMVSGFFR